MCWRDFGADHVIRPALPAGHLGGLCLRHGEQLGVSMFEGFREEMHRVGDIELFARRSPPTGKPPLLLLHGYPQTSAMWHATAPDLSHDYDVICPDLRGYGRSDKPASDPMHATYSKRTMARDMVNLMQGLGYDRFYVGAHDRGGRVAHRMGMDHADAVIAMMILDIAPTREMYANTDADFARAYWHWFFLIQPAPLPENMIGRDPDEYWRLKCCDVPGSDAPFAAAPLAEYLAAFRDVDAIHASCEDYRAAYSIDIAHDDADAGAKLAMPIHVLWGANGVIERCFDALDLWRKRADVVTGQALPSGHYMAEEIPDQITTQMRAFFQSFQD